MKKNDARKTGYRLAARLCGDRLMIDAQLRERMEEEFAERLDTIRRRRLGLDRRALEESLEWERLGDFRLGSGARLAALRAYREAAFSCCKGDYYDYDEGLRPLWALQLRFRRLCDKMAALCGDDGRLRALIPTPEW